MTQATRPLAEKRIVVTRPQHQAGPLIEALEERGARVIRMPVIDIVPMENLSTLDQALHNLVAFHWVIFTSANAVSIVLARMETLGIPAQAMAARCIAAIGPATARALAAHGLRAQFIPDQFVGEAVARDLPAQAGERALLPRAAGARPILPKMLSQRGVQVHEVPIYRAMPARPKVETLSLISQGVEAVTLTSPSTVNAFYEILTTHGLHPVHSLGEPLFACIGPITATAARQHGLRPLIIARQYNAQGLVQALLEAFSEAVEP